MQTGYFNAAWQDIKNSPGWFGKVALLALVAMIPIFGWIVVMGYLFGWARDIAWGVHAPLPARVFGNEDGKLYSRGFFVWVIALACSLLPWAVEVIGGIMTGASFSGSIWHSYHNGFLSFPLGMASGIVGLAFFVVSIAAYFFSAFFEWVGSMRMSIYGRLSAGFQFGKMWAMIRHDFGGILRIFGMALLMAIIAGIIVSVLVFVVVFLAVFLGALLTGGNLNINAPHIGGSVLGLILSIGGFGILLGLVLAYVGLVMAVFIVMMITRSLGYWTRQFNVPAWRGQDDPMPFQLVAAPMPGSPYPPHVPPQGSAQKPSQASPKPTEVPPQGPPPQA